MRLDKLNEKEKEKRRRKTKAISTINRVKKGVDVKAILNHYKAEQMKESSSKYINCCCPLPSHEGQDKNPSFGMINDKGTERNGRFKCWSCGGGDVIEFIKRMEGADFNGAKKFLVNMGGLEDPYSISLLDREIKGIREEEGLEEKELVKTSLPVMFPNANLIAKYMVENESRNFEKKRAFKVIEKFMIGMSMYFWKIRIIIPIFDHRGNIISFFAQNPEDNQDKLFGKGAQTGRMLFGLNHFIGKTKRIILTEGIWDALRLISYGYPAVASFSTSFTPQQANLLTVYFDEVYCGYDSDKGGEIGLERIGRFLYPILDIKDIIWPDNNDPCDCTKKEINKAIREAKNVQFFDNELL